MTLSAGTDDVYNCLMAIALVGLGSNLGNREGALDRGVALLREEPGVHVTAVSGYRCSKPAGGPQGQDDFLNAAALLETSLSPETLLSVLQRIEERIGRVRAERWGARAIDLDLLLVDRLELRSPTLELPHPRMGFRRFVLEPSAEIAPDLIWPVSGWTIRRLLENLNTTPKYIALGGLKSQRYRETMTVLSRHAHIQTLSERPGSHAVQLLKSSSAKFDQWLVSDFWLEQSFAEWLLTRNPRPTSTQINDWKREAHSLIKPRLVILDNSHVAAAPGSEEVQSHLRKLIRTGEVGPVIDVSSHADVVAEVLAAMQAME